MPWSRPFLEVVVFVTFYEFISPEGAAGPGRARIPLPVGRDDILEHRTIRYERTHGPFSDPSGSAVADPDFPPLDNDRHSPGPAGELEHLFEFYRVLLDIGVIRLFAVRPPGVGCVASAIFPVNNDFFIHETLQLLFSGILYLLIFFFVKIFGESVSRLCFI